MPLTYTYADAYLSRLITDDREARAIADVAEEGALPMQWVSRLVVLRAYVLTCLESRQSPDDLFGAKLSSYNKEYDQALSRARAAQAAQATGTPSGGASFFTVSLARS